MPVVLDVHVLPRGHQSRTRRLRQAFLDAYRESHPDTTVVEVDLANSYQDLPAFDEWDIQAKLEMMYGEGRLDEATAGRWDQLTRLTDQMHSAQLLLVSTPMWNFSIPWHLKRWIDCVVQPRLTFQATESGYRGLLAGRRAVVLATRDGAYGQGSPYEPFDFQVPYLRAVLGLMGLDPVDVVVGEPLSSIDKGAAEAALAAATDRAQTLARSL